MFLPCLQVFSSHFFKDKVPRLARRVPFPWVLAVPHGAGPNKPLHLGRSVFSAIPWFSDCKGRRSKADYIRHIKKHARPVHSCLQVIQARLDYQVLRETTKGIVAGTMSYETYTIPAQVKLCLPAILLVHKHQCFIYLSTHTLCPRPRLAHATALYTKPKHPFNSAARVGKIMITRLILIRL